MLAHDELFTGCTAVRDAVKRWFGQGKHKGGSMAIDYRPMQPGEETAVADMVARVFNEFVAPGYSAQGVQEFMKYAAPDALLTRAQLHHFTLLATAQDRVVGMIEVRNHNHISMLFVEKSFQRQGIAAELLRKALDICRAHNPDLTEISVNSSPYAVPVYERLGFRQEKPEQVINGIRFIPMILTLPSSRH